MQRATHRKIGGGEVHHAFKLGGIEDVALEFRAQRPQACQLEIRVGNGRMFQRRGGYTYVVERHQTRRRVVAAC